MKARERGRAPSVRQLRVGEEIRHCLAAVLNRGDLRDPDLRGVSITVSEVRLSPDLRNATAYVMPLGGERTTLWIADCISYLRENGLGSMNATDEAAANWDREINTMANQTLYPLTNSWYVGANIPGKPRQFLAHLRGSQYFDRLNEVAQKGYEGFVFKDSA